MLQFYQIISFVARRPAAPVSSIFFVALLFLSNAVLGQTSSHTNTTSLSIKKDSVYHWQVKPENDTKNKYVLSLNKEYISLEKPDYTPEINLQQWSAYNSLQQFAASLSNNTSFTGEYVLLVNSKGTILQAKTRSTTNKATSDTLIQLLKGSKTAGPSYIQNKAVPTYLPCIISIKNKQVQAL